MMSWVKQGWNEGIWPFVKQQTRVFVFLAMILVVVGWSRSNTEHIGDKLQVILPVAALGCAMAEGRGVAFFGRYLLLEVGVKGPKALLGEADINHRPDGGLRGFPSGHTAAATFGATALATSCMKHSRLAQGAVLTSAAFVGGSRIEADKHYLWQVLAGALWGWFVQSAALVGFDRGFRRFWTAAGRGISRLREAWRNT